MANRPLSVLLVSAAAIAAAPAHAGATLAAYYTGEVLHNADGGIRSGGAYLSDAGVTVDVDLTDLFGGTDANFFAYFLWNNSSTFSDRYSGDAQVVSNIDAEQALRVYELWYQQRLSRDVTLRFGLYDLNSEFDAIGTARLFLNSSHGIGAEYAQSGRAGPSIFPVTSLAARLDWTINNGGTLRYAILDGVPGDPNDPSRTTIDLGGADGVLHALEYNYERGSGPRFGFGGWLYSGDFDRIDPQPGTTRDDGNGGLYAFVDTPLYSSASGVQISGFLRYGVANDDLNVFESYLGAGAVATGLIPTRPDDRLGIALASARTGEPFDRASGGANRHETIIELTYSTRIRDWLRVQPDIQYVIHPGVDPTLDSALVFGLRFELTASHEWQ
ncbi:MAG: carbohydrate porin [Woeseiaceae bacterium]|nr:carbohydrate porin [Woeseiaceae bacterium]